MELHVTYRSELELLTCQTPTKELKYRVFQIYGQKYVRIMDSTINPESGTEVFASNIPRNIPIENLFKFFARCGEIYQLRLLMDFSGCNRGKCFVQYRRVQSSREAICCLHDEVIDNEQKVFVKLSLNNNQLILKSIPGWFSEQQIREIVVRTIGEGLTCVLMKRSRVPFRNYCFCTYRDHQFAIMAHKKSWPFINVGGVVIDVHWAVPELLRYSANLYFTNFSLDMTKSEFFAALVKLINVKTLVQFRIVKSYGSITFANSQAMRKAEEALKNLTIRGIIMKFSRTPFKVGICIDEFSSQYFKSRPPHLAPPERKPPPQSFSLFGCYSVPNQPFHANMPIFMPRIPAIPPYSFYNGVYMSVSKEVRNNRVQGEFVKDNMDQPEMKFCEKNIFQAKNVFELLADRSLYF